MDTIAMVTIAMVTVAKATISERFSVFSWIAIARELVLVARGGVMLCMTISNNGPGLIAIKAVAVLLISNRMKDNLFHN